MKQHDLRELSDIELVELSRTQEKEAYSELWNRHYSAVVAAARRFTGFDPEDIAQEAFMRVLHQVRAGKGPSTAFRSYVVMTARNIATNTARSAASREVTGAEEWVFEQSESPQPDMAQRVLSSELLKQLFASLPERWREVLWLRDVNGTPVKDFSKQLGLSENATSALLRRAREGLKSAWIDANLQTEAPECSECEWVSERIVRHARGRLAADDGARVARHVAACARCERLDAQARSLAVGQPHVWLPLVFAAGAGLTGVLTQQGTPAQAAAVQPSTGGGLSFEPLRSFAPLMKSIAVGASASMVAAVMASSLTISPVEGAEISHAQADLTASSPAAEAASDAEDAAAEADPPSAVATDDDGDSAQGAADGPDKTASSDVERSENFADEMGADGEVLGVEHVALSAAAIDGVETGVYPRLIGRASPGATVYLTATNDRGRSVSLTAYADSSGTWYATLDDLNGTVQLSGSQEYAGDDGTLRDEEVVLGTFEVGRGLTIRVQQTGQEETTIVVSGLTGSTKNQVVTIESNTLGVLAAKAKPDSTGSFTLVVPQARAQLGNLYYWQGDTSVGPERVWWKNDDAA